MNEVNKTLFIPLYGKAMVSRQHIILNDPDAERIWDAEGFPIKGKSKSKWLSYNMAMRARVFDEWTDTMLQTYTDAVVIHVGCGLDSRYRRIVSPYGKWYDCDLAEVISLRKKYYSETENYRMAALDASDPGEISRLPESDAAIIVLEGLSMYLTNGQLYSFLKGLRSRYSDIRVLMDIYTDFGAKASKYKNPVNDVGVTRLYGVKDINALLEGSGLAVKAEHSFTPDYLIDQLKPSERLFFRMLFTGSFYGKIYRLYELESIL